jgi:KaiC/GvpD/RAD55 family RecA-like ATPase
VNVTEVLKGRLSVYFGSSVIPVWYEGSSSQQPVSVSDYVEVHGHTGQRPCEITAPEIDCLSVVIKQGTGDSISRLIPPRVTTTLLSVITSISSSQRITSSQTEVGRMVLGQPPLGTFGLMGILGLAAIVSILVVARRRKTQPTRLTPSLGQKSTAPEQPQILGAAAVNQQAQGGRNEGTGIATKIRAPIPSSESKAELSTGFEDLDLLLGGGLPKGYAVLLLSPPYDERDLLLRKIISSGSSSGMPTFYISDDLSRTRDMLNLYENNFYAFSPHAPSVGVDRTNVYEFSSVANLSDLNISLVSALRTLAMPSNKPKMMILDILSDVLLRHKTVTSRKWLSDFTARRKTEGFTILATLNPMLAKEGIETVIDLFDGVIEIYEKDFKDRPKRFLAVKKMYNRRYSESELVLDRDELF